jgi:hypothetical protein
MPSITGIFAFVGKHPAVSGESAPQIKIAGSGEGVVFPLDNLCPASALNVLHFGSFVIELGQIECPT